MKRIMPSLLLAFALAACQDEGPTVPTGGPELAKGGNKCETPPCGKDGGDGGGEYTAISLGERRVASKARDLSSSGQLVVGESEDASGNLVAMVWTDQVRAPLPLGTGFSQSTAYGINDGGDIIVGSLGPPWFESTPVKWSGAGWTPQLLNPVTIDHDSDPTTEPIPYQSGEAYDVNDAGTVAGVSVDPTDADLPWTAATVWEADGLDGRRLPSAFDRGTGSAFAISAAGYVAGSCRTENPNSAPWHATLWRPPYGDGDICDLNVLLGLAPDAKSSAKAITDLPNGNVLVAVGSLPLEVAWTGDDCVIVVEYPDLANAGDAYDVAVVSDEIQAVAKKGDRPARWLVASGEGTTLADSRGPALGINDSGWIVGWTSVKGKEHAWLWVPTTE
jgi:uncharacterized membrane protein